MNNSKVCSKCGVEKPLSEYSKNGARRLRASCKQCDIEYQKKYREENKERIKEWDKKYREGNKERKKKYYKENKERRNRQDRERKKADPEFKLRGSLRTRLYRAVKSQNTHKSRSTLKLTGCTLGFLKWHLEQQFIDGMSWDNYGEWHIDHIIPCSYFDLTKKSEQEKCFHYSNLQPLWGIDNISKNNKLPEGWENE